MSLEAIIIDRRPAYLQAQAAASLLLLPLGARTLLERLGAHLRRVDVHTLTIVPDFPSDAEYAAQIARRAPEARIASAATLDEMVDAAEPADLLLLLDSRFVPVSGYDLAGFLADVSRCRLVKHLVALQRSPDGTQERVVCDAEHRIRAIRRLYDGVTQFDLRGVSSSVLSAAAARHLDTLSPLCLATLRARLAAGSTPSRDITAPTEVLDLAEEHDLLTLHERCLHDDVAAGAELGLRLLAPDVWGSAGAEVHPESRVFGPVILQRGARIEAGAIVIGPAVVGADAVVTPGALLAQGLVVQGVRISAAQPVVGRVSAGGKTAGLDAEQAAAAAGVRTPVLLPGLRAERGRQGSWQSDTPAARRPFESLVKRVLDACAALVGLVLLLPLLAVVAVLVKLTSRGPIFFSHEREGIGGRVFRCWKFRTMVERAHQQQRALYQQNAVDGPQFKMSHDPRVTPLGHWLRTTNIDELPQLWNVVRGEMSLIGPRPSPFRENQICVPWRQARLSVRPGITGLWQVCRHERAAGDFHQWIHFDMLYVRHWSLALDVRIMLATLGTLGGRWNVPLTWMIPAPQLQRYTNLTMDLQAAAAVPPARGTSPSPAEERGKQPALAGME